jgi:hypothetical protein
MERTTGGFCSAEHPPPPGVVESVHAEIVDEMCVSHNILKRYLQVTRDDRLQHLENLNFSGNFAFSGQSTEIRQHDG